MRHAYTQQNPECWRRINSLPPSPLSFLFINLARGKCFCALCILLLKGCSLLGSFPIAIDPSPCRVVTTVLVVCYRQTKKNSFGEFPFGLFSFSSFSRPFPSRLQHFFCYSGIIYLSRLPPYMKPVRHALTRLPEHAPLPYDVAVRVGASSKRI